jgi:hypothetical protein
MKSASGGSSTGNEASRSPTMMCDVMHAGSSFHSGIQDVMRRGACGCGGSPSSRRMGSLRALARRESKVRRWLEFQSLGSVRPRKMFEGVKSRRFY